MVLLNKIKNKLRINYRKKRWPGLIEAYSEIHRRINEFL